jgi:hypothetical protein
VSRATQVTQGQGSLADSTAQSIVNAATSDSSQNTAAPSSPTTITSAAPGTTPGQSSGCNTAVGEQACGPFCCADGQFCAVRGQCQVSDQLPSTSASIGQHTSPSVVVTLDSSTLTRGSSSQYIVGSQTLSPGGTIIVISGTTVSLTSQGTALVVNGETTPVVVASSTNAIPTTSGAFVLPNGQTLGPGSTVAPGSAKYAAPSSGVLVVNGQTAPGASSQLGSLLEAQSSPCSLPLSAASLRTCIRMVELYPKA